MNQSKHIQWISPKKMEEIYWVGEKSNSQDNIKVEFVRYKNSPGIIIIKTNKERDSRISRAKLFIQMVD